MLSRTVIAVLLSCTTVLAAPLNAVRRDVKVERRHDDYDYGYGKYASYGSYPPPPGGYGKYADYGEYKPGYKRNVVRARDVERRHDDYDYGYGKYASYGSYPPPEGGYGKYADYGEYKPGYKRDTIIETREAEANPAPVAALVPAPVPALESE